MYAVPTLSTTYIFTLKPKPVGFVVPTIPYRQTDKLTQKLYQVLARRWVWKQTHRQICIYWVFQEEW
jgi:hypothetical protein